MTCGGQHIIVFRPSSTICINTRIEPDRACAFPGLLASLDVFVSSFLQERMSLSFLEAMAAAKPIVAPSIAQNAELIEDGVTGLLTPVKSPEKIADAITMFVREPALTQKCATKARERLLKNYTLDRLFQEPWDIYLDLLRGK